MIKAIVIDDIENARKTLKHDISQFCPDVVVIGEADSVNSGVEIIKQMNPDLIFLDIQLGDGDGFEILKHFKDPNFSVIFTTSHNDYAIKAIKFSALDYLLKPVQPDELIEAVGKMKKNKASNPQYANFELLLENLKNLHSGKNRIALHSSDKVHLVNVSNIIRCESSSNYTTFFLNTKEQIVVTRTLKEFEKMLEDDNFFRIHHSHLINLSFMKEFVKNDGGYVVMTTSEKIPVSSRKRENFIKHLEKFR